MYESCGNRDVLNGYSVTDEDMEDHVCVRMVNDSLWEGGFYPRLDDGSRKKFNVYAKTREECEKVLAKMIAEKKAEIAAEEVKMKTA